MMSKGLRRLLSALALVGILAVLAAAHGLALG